MGALSIVAKGIKEAERALSHLKDDTAIRRAVFNSTARAFTTARKEVAKRVTSRYRVKSGDVRDAIGEPKVAAMHGEMLVSGHMLKLEEFSVSPNSPYRAGQFTKKGKRKRAPRSLSVAVLKGSKKPLEHSFVQIMPSSGHRGVFQRMNGKDGRPKKMTKDGKKEAIRELPSPAVAIMADNKEVGPVSRDTMDKAFLKRLDHEVERLLGGH
jgi:hypothetical protein